MHIANENIIQVVPPPCRPIWKYLAMLNREGNGTPLQYLAWKIPWVEDPGGLPSMGSHRVGYN